MERTLIISPPVTSFIVSSFKMGFIEEVRLNGEEGEKCYFKCLKLRGKQDKLNPVDIRFFKNKYVID